MRNLYVLILTLVFALSVQSCGNGCSFSSKIKLITGRPWKYESYVDYSANREFHVIPEKYDFKDDGTFIKIKDGDTISGTWSFDDCDYLRVNGNIFKIAELSRKMMVLRYGDLDFMYRSER